MNLFFNYLVTLRRQRPTVTAYSIHVDVINWKHFPCYWPFVWGIRRSSADSPNKSQWRGALTFYLICAWINGVNNRKAYDLRRHRAHCNVTVMNTVAVLTTTGQRIRKQYFDLFVLGYSDFGAIRLVLPLVSIFFKRIHVWLWSIMYSESQPPVRGSYEQNHVYLQRV